MPVIETVCKSLQIGAVAGSSLKQEYFVSYTIAFHVAVYDETQRLAWKTQK
jgi:hypothetical protein